MSEFFSQWGWYIFSAIISVVQLLVIWAMWSLRKQFVSREEYTEDCKDHEKKCAKQCRVHADERQKLALRQTAIETAHDALPTDGDIDAIKDRLGAIEGDIKTLVATADGQAQLMARIEKPLNLLMEHHLKETK